VKIVHVEDNFLPTSGYQLNFLAKWNVRHGHEVTIVVSDSLSPWTSVGFTSNSLEKMDSEYESQYGVKIVRVHSKRRISGREVLERQLLEIVTSEKPDIVMVHGFGTITGLRFVNRIGKLEYPIIEDSHMYPVASINKLKELFNVYMRTFVAPKVTKFALKIVAVSKATKNYVMDSYGIPSDLIPVIPFGTDTDLFKPDPVRGALTRKELNTSEDAFVLIYTGKIVEDKKVLLLAEAFASICKQKASRNPVLILVGSGSGSYYEKVIRTLESVNEYVRYIPTQEVWKLPKFYQAADLAVWPGACSLSFFDAQACGLPVIAENIAGNDERLSHNNGWLFRSDSVGDLKDKINEALELSSEELKQKGYQGMEIAVKNQSYDKISREFEKLMIQEIERFRKGGRK
jgi:glycosyltransferase involved in cell wall biosynthesis